MRADTVTRVPGFVLADAASFAIAAVILLTLPVAPPAQSPPTESADGVSAGTATA
jgi:hypothetical protein